MLRLNTINIKVEVTWLDDEKADKELRKAKIAEKVMRLMSHEWGEMICSRHAVMIELLEVDGYRVAPVRVVLENGKETKNDRAL